jgi:DNA (cytosine-5)-methyltransferase 1
MALPAVRGARLTLPPRDPRLNASDSAARRWLRDLPRPWAVDLFAGAGGLSLGLEQAGFSIVAAADNDPIALETHAANIGGLTWCGDLNDPHAFIGFLAQRGIRKVDLVAGGPPCQPFSRAGRAKIRSLVSAGYREGQDPRVGMWEAYAEIVAALQPRVVLLENVPDMARWEDGAVLDSVHAMLRGLGYEPDTRVLQGEEFGIPQHRARLIVIGLRSGRFTWPKRRPAVTVKDAVGDLPPVGPNHRVRRISYGGPQTRFQARARRGVRKSDTGVILDHCTRAVRADDAAAYALLSQGQTYAQVPEYLRRYRIDIFEDKYKRLAWNELSRTITAHIAKDGYWYIHPEQHRTLSIREAARIQTFPDWFRFAGYPTNQFRQIGNAVPPALARAVGYRLRAALNTRGPVRRVRTGERLREWFRRMGRPAGAPEDPWIQLLYAVCFGLKNRRDRDDRVAALARVARTPKRLARCPEDLAAVLRTYGCEDRSGKAARLATTLVERHAGRVPATERELRELPWVTDHAASKLSTEIFHTRAVVLDAATRRVVDRLVGYPVRGRWAARLEVLRLAGAEGADEEFNRAIRKLGSEVCTPADPDCSRCPIARECATAARLRTDRSAN